MEPYPDFDLYLELEVSPTASQPTIEAAFRSLAKRYHPDVAADGATAARMKRLNLARDWLLDPVRRADYDRFLASHNTAGQTPHIAGQKAAGPTTPRGGRTTPRTRQPKASPTCTKCGEVFATQGGLRFHQRFSGCKS